MKIGFYGTDEMYSDFVSAADLLSSETGIDVSIENIDISSNLLPYDMRYCIIRATNAHKERIKRIVENNPRVDFLDNRERFFDNAGKIETSLMREYDGTGAKNYTYEQVVYLECEYPIVAKPIDGRFAREINYIYSHDDFLRFKERIFRSDEYNIQDFMFQEMLQFVDEFRALRLVINGETKTFITRRKTMAGHRNPNIANRVPLPTGRIKAFLDEHRSWKTGIVGYDIGMLSDGTFKIIEENRSPMFERTEKRLRRKLPNGIPYEIVKMIIKDSL